MDGADEITFDEIIVHNDILNEHMGSEYTGVNSFENITVGNVEIFLASFRANEKAITHYYTVITSYSIHYTKLYDAFCVSSEVRKLNELSPFIRHIDSSLTNKAQRIFSDQRMYQQLPD